MHGLMVLCSVLLASLGYDADAQIVNPITNPALLALLAALNNQTIIISQTTGKEALSVFSLR